MSFEESNFVQFNDLEKAGKIHKQLQIRLYLLGLIAVVVLGILIYDIAWKGLVFLPMMGFATFGFLLGFFVFTRMSKVTWDEKKEMVKLGRFDVVSFLLLAGYIGYRISIEFYLKYQYHDALFVSGASLAMLFGGMFGRLIGMVWAVARVHKQNAKVLQ